MDVNLWQPYRVEVGATCRAKIGPLQLWLRRSGDELHIAVERDPDPDRHPDAYPLAPQPDAPSAEELPWARWIAGKNGDVVRLIPTTPDKPVVVRPEVPVRVPSKQEALFFVNFPLWVRVTVGDGDAVALCEEPSVVLSKTWFGDPMSGALCYSLRTRARRDIAETQPRPHRAVCPVRIRNSADRQLELERFCVQVEHLTLYQGATRLWANQLDITFRGDNEISQLNYAERPPAYEATTGVVCKARTPAKKSLLASLGRFFEDNG